jgi:adenylate cyclase class 2
VKLETNHTKKHKMVELKARVDDHNVLREKLLDLGAEYFGTVHQKDQYFVVPEGRLKLRTTEGKDIVELIYYERENLSGPKIDDAYILRVLEADDLNVILKKILKPLNVIEKDRGIYQYNGTEIHLDNVTNLGIFVEFERRTSSKQKNLNKDRQVLEKLMKALKISPNNLVALSYSDLFEK